MLNKGEAGTQNFIFLNYHSSAAINLHHQLESKGLNLKALTFDSYLVEKDRLVSLGGLVEVAMIDTTEAWQTLSNLHSREAGENWAIKDCENLKIAIDYAKLKLLNWIGHRERFGQGITELQTNFIVTNTLCNALALLEETRPCLIVSLLAACTPFDICVMSLAERLGIVVASLNEVNLRGIYYLAFNQFEHAEDIGVLDDNHNAALDSQAAARQYLKGCIEKAPYYINSDLHRDASSLKDDADCLKVLSAKSLNQSKALDASRNMPYPLHTSLELQRLGFISSRGLKRNTALQAQKERMRASYLQYIASNLHEAPQKPAILILLDYYPEITRYPIGGDDYFYSNYFVLARIIKEASLFGLCDSSQIYVKEHPAMLEVSSHSHPRAGLDGLIKNYGASIISPLLKTATLLASNPALVVITGVSNAGVEASLLGCTTITTSKPWWLCMPNTYHCNIYTGRLRSYAGPLIARCHDLIEMPENLTHICKEAGRAYLSFIAMHSVNLDISMAEIDTLLSEKTIMNSNEYNSIAMAIMRRLMHDAE